MIFHFHLPLSQIGEMTLRQARALLDELPPLLGAGGSESYRAAGTERPARPSGAPAVQSRAGSSASSAGGILLDGLYEAVKKRMAAEGSVETDI